jgi:hypothetical protein
MLNGSEGDKDCGAICGVAAKLCALGAGCKKDADCSTNTCSECAGKCIQAPTQCYTMGTNCYQCADSQACSTAFDCKSLNCDATSKTCLAPSTCYGKVLDAGSCSADCLMLIRCLGANGTTVAAALAAPDSNCGPNKMNKGTAMYDEAKSVLTAAGCTTP